MKKFVVVKDGKVRRVVICSEENKPKLSKGETIHEATGKINRGDLFGPQIETIKATTVNSYSKKDLTIGAAIGAALGIGSIFINDIISLFF